jgi:nicotinamide-nucleotide amidase
VATSDDATSTSSDEVVPASGPAAPDPQLVASALHAALMDRHALIASAESLTGGALGDLLSAAPGASDTYLGGVVSYSTEVKRKILGVSEQTVDRHGVVSAECAAEMAAGVRALLDADYGVSTTGVAGPTTQEGKPVGLAFVGVAGPDGVHTKELRLDGDRAQIRQQTVLEAVQTVLEHLDAG